MIKIERFREQFNLQEKTLQLKKCVSLKEGSDHFVFWGNEGL